MRAPITIDRALVERLVDLPNMEEALHATHKDVEECADKHRRRAIEAHNAATNIIVSRIVVGDFVVIARSKRASHKLSFK